MVLDVTFCGEENNVFTVHVEVNSLKQKQNTVDFVPIENPKHVEFCVIQQTNFHTLLFNSVIIIIYLIILHLLISYYSFSYSFYEYSMLIVHARHVFPS